MAAQRASFLSDVTEGKRKEDRKEEKGDQELSNLSHE
jgi:hypothetical protein